MIENLDAIGTALGMKAGEFKTMYESKDKIEIKLDEIEIVKKTDLETRMNNYSNDQFKTKKDAILEIYNKEVFRDVFGMTIDKTENSKTLAEKAKAKILADAKLPPDAKVTELQSDLEKMRANAADWEKKHGDLATATATEKKQFQIESSVINELPKVKTKIPIQDLKALFELKYKPKYNDAGVIVLHNDKGEVIKNTKTLNPATLTEVMAEFQTPYIEEVTGGSGGKDNPGAGAQGGMTAFIEEMEKAGKPVGSKAFVDEMRVRIAAKTLKT